MSRRLIDLLLIALAVAVVYEIWWNPFLWDSGVVLATWVRGMR